MKKKILKAIIYARTSSNVEYEPTIDEQIDVCMEFADEKDRNICVVDIIADQGFDGIALQRPGLIQILEALMAGEADCIIVDDICRVSSNMIELAYLMAYLMVDILPELDAHMFFEDISVDCDNPKDAYGCLMSVLENYSEARGVNEVHIDDIDVHYVR